MYPKEKTEMEINRVIDYKKDHQEFSLSEIGRILFPKEVKPKHAKGENMFKIPDIFSQILKIILYLVLAVVLFQSLGVIGFVILMVMVLDYLNASRGWNLV